MSARRRAEQSGQLLVGDQLPICRDERLGVGVELAHVSRVGEHDRGPGRGAAHEGLHRGHHLVAPGLAVAEHDLVRRRDAEVVEGLLDGVGVGHRLTEVVVIAGVVVDPDHEREDLTAPTGDAGLLERRRHRHRRGQLARELGRRGDGDLVGQGANGTRRRCRRWDRRHRAGQRLEGAEGGGAGPFEGVLGGHQPQRTGHDGERERGRSRAGPSPCPHPQPPGSVNLAGRPQRRPIS